MNIRTALHAWLDRHVPLMDGAPSHLDLLDGGRVAVEQVPAQTKRVGVAA